MDIWDHIAGHDKEAADRYLEYLKKRKSARTPSPSGTGKAKGGNLVLYSQSAFFVIA